MIPGSNNDSINVSKDHKKKTNMMKASFRDKYIEICEHTMQKPDDRYLVKGTLLSHLKLNVCPIIGSRGDLHQQQEPQQPQQLQQPQQHYEHQRARSYESTLSSKTSSVKDLLTKRNSTSPLQRKKCFRRNSDGRSRAEKARSMEVFERKIANSNSPTTSPATSPATLPRTKNSLHLATSDGNFIPEEIKQQILKARHDCMMAKRSESLNDNHKFSHVRQNSNPNSISENTFSNNNNNKTMGTLINVSYRDSRRNLVVEQKGAIHPFLKITPSNALLEHPASLTRSHSDIHRLSSEGREVVADDWRRKDSYHSSGSSNESDYDEIENPYSFVSNNNNNNNNNNKDSENDIVENPYSTVFSPKVPPTQNPFYFVLEDRCEKHGFDTIDCVKCSGISDGVLEHIYTEPSTRTTNASSFNKGSAKTNNNNNVVDGSQGGMLPMEYLTRTSVSQQNSNASTTSGVSSLGGVDESDGDMMFAKAEPIYHVLEELQKEQQHCSPNARPRSALSNIRETSFENEEIFV